MYTLNDEFNAPQGWVCPKCGRVYSPSTPMCWYCGGGRGSIINAPTTKVDWTLPQTITTCDEIPPITIQTSNSDSLVEFINSFIGD